MTTKEDIGSRVISLLQRLANDWEYGGVIRPETLIFSDLGFQSLDAVILGNTLQQEYGQPIPYSDLFADIGQRTSNDVTVGEWIDFTYQYLARQANGAGVGH